MSRVRAVYIPWFDSQLDSSQEENAPQVDKKMDRAKLRCQRNKRVDAESEKSRLILKVKLPNHNKKVSKEYKIPRKRNTELVANKTKTSVDRGERAQEEGAANGQSGTGTNSRPATDVFSFPETSTSEAKTEKDKAKLSVLRSISRVLEENKFIRQRLAALSQAS